jgi:hypothetical protein
VPLASFEFSHPLLFLLLQHLSHGSVNLSSLQVEVTRAPEAAAATEVAHVMVVLAAETSAREAIAARDTAAILVKDAEGRAAPVEKVARERVSRVEAESVAMLPSAREEAEGLVWKIVLLKGELKEASRAREVVEENSRGFLDATAYAERWWEESEREHWEKFEEFTLLQTRGSELCLAIVGPPRVRNHLSEGMRIAAICHTKMVKELAVLRRRCPMLWSSRLHAYMTKSSGWKLWMSWLSNSRT